SSLLSFLCLMTCFSFPVTATTALYTLSLHDALPIYRPRRGRGAMVLAPGDRPRHGDLPQPRPGRLLHARRITLLGTTALQRRLADRKSTRLNSSHLGNSYAVFCLKKKKKI